jgi:hypothetical protein
MIEPNRLSAPGERAALERVEAIVERVDGLRLEMFAPSQVALLDPEDHAHLMGELEAEADRCGRRELLDDVLERVRSALNARVAQPSRFDPVGRYPLTPGRPEDTALILMTVTDAVAVAVVEDRLAPQTASRLSAPGRTLLGLPPIGDPGPPTEREPRIEEPSAEDWAAAAADEPQPDEHSPFPVGARVGFATMGAVLFGSIAVFVGAGIGQTGAGLLAALAIVAVCWLIATYHRA